jgi:hypothetical protein
VDVSGRQQRLGPNKTIKFSRKKRSQGKTPRPDNASWIKSEGVEHAAKPILTILTLIQFIAIFIHESMYSYYQKNKSEINLVLIDFRQKQRTVGVLPALL